MPEQSKADVCFRLTMLFYDSGQDDEQRANGEVGDAFERREKGKTLANFKRVGQCQLKFNKSNVPQPIKHRHVSHLSRSARI